MLYAGTVKLDELSLWLRLHRASASRQRQWLAAFENQAEPKTRIMLKNESGELDDLPTLERKMLEIVDRWLDAEDDHCIVTFACPEYPKALRSIYTPPMLLFLSGHSELLSCPSLAVVGSRNATAGGLAVVEELCKPLARAGICLVSGMAMGIDARAHRSALDVAGASIGVLGCGIDRIYPTRNRALFHEMRAQGLLLSEYFPGTPPRIEQFPQRNRIITGLSQGLLVVEAGLSSGSLQSAKHAVEQNKNIYAVPGSIMNPMAQGCHRLIQQGAQLVTCAEDILADFPAQGSLLEPLSSSAPPFSEHAGNILETGLASVDLLANLDFETTAFETLLQRSELSVSELVNQLIELELAGWIKQVSGGYVRIRR